MASEMATMTPVVLDAVQSPSRFWVRMVHIGRETDRFQPIVSWQTIGSKACRALGSIKTVNLLDHRLLFVVDNDPRRHCSRPEVPTPSEWSVLTGNVRSCANRHPW